MSAHCRRMVTALLSALFVAASCAAAEGPSEGRLDFAIRLDVAKQELSPEHCWFHPRVAAVPGAGRDGKPAAIMTLQKHLQVSDYYSGLWTMRTDDLGKTWTGPTEIPELGWVREPNGIVSCPI